MNIIPFGVGFNYLILSVIDTASCLNNYLSTNKTTEL